MVICAMHVDERVQILRHSASEKLTDQLWDANSSPCKQVLATAGELRACIFTARQINHPSMVQSADWPNQLLESHKCLQSFLLMTVHHLGALCCEIRSAFFSSVTMVTLSHVCRTICAFAVGTLVTTQIGTLAIPVVSRLCPPNKILGAATVVSTDHPWHSIQVLKTFDFRSLGASCAIRGRRFSASSHV